MEVGLLWEVWELGRYYSRRSDEGIRSLPPQACQRFQTWLIGGEFGWREGGRTFLESDYGGFVLDGLGSVK